MTTHLVRRGRSQVFGIIGLILATACGDDDGPTGSLDQFRIDVTPSTVTIGQDTSITLTATVTNVTRNYTITSPTLLFTTENASIARVHATRGTIKGVAGGTTTVHVRYLDQDVPVQVTVRPNAVATASVVPDTIRNLFFAPIITSSGALSTTAAGSGDTARVVVVLRDAEGDTIYCNRCANQANRQLRDVVFTSLDTAKAVVSSTGLVTMRDTSGATQVVFSVPSDNITDTVVIAKASFRPVASVVVSTSIAGAPPATIRIPINTSLQLFAQPRGANNAILANRALATWTSSDTSIVKVDPLGRATTARKLGTATVSATVEGRTGSRTVEVALAP
jgi:hypothetical protein